MNFKFTKSKIIVALILGIFLCLPIAIIINEISQYSLIIGQRTGHEILYTISQSALFIIGIIIFIASYVAWSLFEDNFKPRNLQNCKSRGSF